MFRSWGKREPRVFSQLLEITYDCCHKPSLQAHQTHMTLAQSKGPGRQSRLGSPRKELGSVEAQTVFQQVQWGPSGPLLGEPPGPLCSGVTRAVDRVFKAWRTQMQQLAQQSWAGQHRQTAVPEAGAGWHSRHFSTSINQPAQAEEEDKGRGRGLPPACTPHSPPSPCSHPTQDWPLWSPLGSAPSAGQERDATRAPWGCRRGHCHSETLVSMGVVLKACT